MNKKTFNDSLSDEVLAILIDDTLNFKKTIKTKNIRSHLLKIIPAAAAFALIIGLVNILPAILNNTDTGISDPGPGVYAPTEHLGASGKLELELFLPPTIEKSFFEDRILAYITDERDFDRIISYYIQRDDAFYILDPALSERERNQLLGIFREYTDLTGADIYYMLIDNNMPVPKTVDPAYAHVRFGATENILLLDIEWFTPETYREAIERISAWSDEYKEELFTSRQLNNFEEFIALMEEVLQGIEAGKIYAAWAVNGIGSDYWGIRWDVDDFSEIAHLFNSDGYYIVEVYPYHAVVGYFDENGIYRTEFLGVANSAHEYAVLLENELIPYLNDLLARGLLTQEQHDNNIIPDLLEYYIDVWF
jgi:hypothetical protein